MISDSIKYLSDAISSKGLEPDINLSRPVYVQPEDRIIYRAMRVVIILGLLNTKSGLSKTLISCVDFMLRNNTLQNIFISEYFRGQKNILNKIKSFTGDLQLEFDYNVIEYKSVPWDIRFNDIFMFLHIRQLIEIQGYHKEKNVRISLSTEGNKLFFKLENIFPDEINFLGIFGKRIIEKKAIQIISNNIPKNYWIKNDNL